MCCMFSGGVVSVLARRLFSGAVLTLARRFISASSLANMGVRLRVCTLSLLGSSVHLRSLMRLLAALR